MERKLINFKEKSKGTMRVLTNICLCMLFLFVCLSFNFPLGLLDKEKEDSQTSVNNIIMFASASEDTGASSAPSSEKGGCHYLGAGTKMTMSEGSITGTTKKYGGAVYISSGATFTMTGGTISGCTARYGGAIYVASGGTLNMTGGTIKECGGTYAPAIYVEENATVTVNGEVIDCFYGEYFTPPVPPSELISTDTIMVGLSTGGVAYHYLDYGTYPQTYVGDTMNTTLESWYSSNSPTSQTTYEIRTRTWTSYLYTDGNYYARGSSYPYSSSETYVDGTTVKSSGTTVWFKVEPIRWIILNYDEVQAGTASSIDCLSELCLASDIPFDANKEDNNWVNSDIRTWLNSKFINQAFTTEEQENIETSTVLNNVTDTEGADYVSTTEDGTGITTEDKIYLLSFTEGYALRENSNMSCSPTDFALSNYLLLTTINPYTGATFSTHYRTGSCFWYLRSAGVSVNYNCTAIDYMGGDNSYTNVSNSDLGIRPRISFII